MFNRFVYFLILGFFSINHVIAEKPVFDNGDSIQVDVAENNKSVATIKATDPGGTRIKYNLQNSYGDSRLFSINSSSGVLTFKDSKDYENPQDANNDNIYVARVRARNASKEQSFQIINVYIQDVNDNNPVISNAFTKKTIDENHLFVNQMKGSDADESDALSWSLDPSFSV